MERWKMEYREINVPKEVKEKMEEAVKRAQEQKKTGRRRIIRVVQGAAAVFAILLILPNTSQNVAAAMQKLPVVGDFSKS